MTLDCLLSFKHEIDGNYILFARRAGRVVLFNANLPIIDKRYCPYCGAELVEGCGDLVKEGGWYYSSYECGVEVALYKPVVDNMCSIVAISFPIICGSEVQDDII